MNLWGKTLAEHTELKLEWRAGPPSKPWSEEWFIAETTFGDRVCLTALPEEYTYDFKTADDTYIRADKIKRWMQFPDSEYIAPKDESHDALVKALRECVQDIVFCERVRDPSFNPRSLGVGTVLGDAITALDAVDGPSVASHIRAPESPDQLVTTPEA